MKKLVLCLLILSLSLSIVACGEKVTEPELTSTYVISNWSTLPDSITNISQCVLSGEQILMCCEDGTDEETPESYIASIHTDGSGFSRLPLSLPAPEKLLDIAPDTRSGLWGLCETPNGEEAATYTLLHFDSSLSQTTEIPLNGILEKGDALHPYAEARLNSDYDGNLCITIKYGKTFCFFFDQEGKYLFSLSDAGNLLTVINTGSGQFAVCVRDGMEHFLLPVDLEKQAWGKKMKIGTVNNLFDGSGDKICYLYDSSSFYECGTDFEDKELLFRWADLGLASGDSHVCTLGDGRFAVLSSSFSQTMLNSYEYCVVEPGEDNRTVLTMVSLQPEYSILDAIAQFNKSNRDYRVELRAISPMDENVSDADWSNALMKLNTEMISGKIPDIIDLNHLPVEPYLNQGLIEDLYPYLKNDPNIQEEDYFDHAFDAFSIHGKLPYVTNSALVLTMFADAGAVGTERGWTLDEFAAFKSRGEDIVERVPGRYFLQRLLCADNRFVDWSTGECRFDSPEFIQLLELSKMAESGQETSYGELNEATSCFFVNAASIFDIARYNAQFGGNTNPIGYPGQGKVIHVLSPSNRIGISSTGEHKDGAWAFARIFLEAKLQESGGFFPLRKASFDKIVQAAVKGQSMWAGQLYYGKIQDEDIALAREVLNTAAYSLDNTDGLTDLILSSAAAYFAGDKAAQEVAADIQQKATIYVNEHR